MQRSNIKAVVSWVALVAFMGITRPVQLPVWGLILPFIFLYLALYYSMRAVLEYFARTNPKKLKLEHWVPLVIALSAVVILALQSIGQLSIRDVTAVTLLVMIGYFYVRRNRSKDKK